jgi:hypothetical protein
MSSAIKSSTFLIVYGVLWAGVVFWTFYSTENRMLQAVTILLLITLGFAKSLYQARRMVPREKENVPPARANFDEEDPTDLERPTVLRRREKSHLRVV